jgi:hypothetical protein
MSSDRSSAYTAPEDRVCHGSDNGPFRVRFTASLAARCVFAATGRSVRSAAGYTGPSRFSEFPAIRPNPHQSPRL